MAKRVKGNRRIGQCAYCGVFAEISTEHVIPKSLFTQPYPSHPIVVPACDRCNKDKSPHDDLLRDFLIFDFCGCQHPVAQTLFQTKALRSFRRNSSVLARTVVSDAQLEPLHTRGGIYLGTYPQVRINDTQVQTIFSTIVRGLYFDARRQRLPDNYVFQVRRIYPWDFKEVWRGLKEKNLNGPRIIDDVFGCAFLSATEDPYTTLWFLWFYGSVVFSVSTKAPI